MGFENEESNPRYVNPYTDFGFKKLLGTELNKDLLISFLNALFDGEQVIADIRYLPAEGLGPGAGDRHAIFDVYCENEKGERFIVEMQKAEQQYFKDRSVFYSTFPIQEQAKRGGWDFRLKSVYTIGILNFVFPENEYSETCYHHEVKLIDTADKHVFYDKLTFIYIEMPKFRKREEELVTMFDKWLYALKNMWELMERPAALEEGIFEQLFRQAEIAQFTPIERWNYAESVKVYRDLHNVVRTAEQKGMKAGEKAGREAGWEAGMKERNLEIARLMKADGESLEKIIRYTGLSASEIQKLF